MGRRPPPEPPVPPPWSHQGTVHLIGVDAMTLNAIGPLAAMGKLPNFSRMMAEGCHGPLDGCGLSNSGAIWTSIVTGRHSRDHGIDALDYYCFGGMRLSKRLVRTVVHVGAKRLLRALRDSGILQRRLFTCADVEAKTLWDVVSDAGGRVAVVNWVNTWPAPKVNGCVASDRMQTWRWVELQREDMKDEHLTYPPELVHELVPLVLRPFELPVDAFRPYVDLPEKELAALPHAEFDKRSVQSELRFSISSDTSTRRMLEHCLDAFAPVNLAAAFFWGMDKVQHAAFDCIPFIGGPRASRDDIRRFGNVVPQSYVFIDSMVGALLARMGPGDSLFVLSDHGFAFEPKRGRYGHKRSKPPGVFFAFGPAFRAGYALDRASIYDVAPTVLRAAGYPLADDLEGRCLEDALDPAWAKLHPAPASVATYGRPNIVLPQGVPMHG
jgi:predicted AlkP superfamily phosphohydrolase/phosphomutase